MSDKDTQTHTQPTHTRKGTCMHVSVRACAQTHAYMLAQKLSGEKVGKWGRGEGLVQFPKTGKS